MKVNILLQKIYGNLWDFVEDFILEVLIAFVKFDFILTNI